MMLNNKTIKSIYTIAGMIKNATDLKDYNDKELNKAKQNYDNAIDTLSIVFSEPITYYTRHCGQYNRLKTMTLKHFKDAKDKPYELGNLYKDLDYSVVKRPQNEAVARALYHPTNIMINAWDTYQQNQKAQDLTIKKYKKLLPKEEKHGDSIHSLFSALKLYPNKNAGLTYNNIQTQGIAYLHHQNIPNHFNLSTLHLKPLLAQPLIMIKGNYQTFNYDILNHSKYNFATDRDCSVVDIDKIAKTFA